MTLTWSPYGIVLHFLLKMSKWIPKSQTCPSQVLGKIFYDPLKMRYVKNRKNPKSFVKNDQNPFLFVLVGKEIVCRLQKYCWILFPPMKVKIYNRKTEIYSFCRKRPVANQKNKNYLRFLKFFKTLYFSKISMGDQTSTMSSSS